jgi:NAD(P)-dependent dehydrogenase (short-subunit alcohol dehydrogenase family)
LKDRRVVLVTGGNRGIGYEVVKLVAADELHTVVLTARDHEAGRVMTEKAGAERGNVVFCPLDVLDEGSIKAAVEFVTTNFGRLDVLVNNAGVSFGPAVEPPQTRQTTVATNVQGVLKVTDAFRPLLVGAKGQVVNVGSVSGRLIFKLGTPEFKEKIKRTCTNRASLSVLSAKLVSGIAPWRQTDSVYGASKLLAHVVTRILAFEHQRDGIEVPVRSVCPGYVSTRIGGPMAPLTPEQGAEVVVGLVRERTDIQTGSFWTRTGVRDDCAWDVVTPAEPDCTE